MIMTIEEKAKAYDEALERAREYHNVDIDNTMDVKVRGILEYLFPELAESEDEKIRQLLIRFVAYDMSDNYSDDFTPADCVAWLEKQGESYTKRDVGDAWLKGMCDAKRELEKQGEQKSAWSEDDEKHYKACLQYFPDMVYYKDYQWLKSLKQRMGG